MLSVGEDRSLLEHVFGKFGPSLELEDSGCRVELDGLVDVDTNRAGDLESVFQTGCSLLPLRHEFPSWHAKLGHASMTSGEDDARAETEKDEPGDWHRMQVQPEVGPCRREACVCSFDARAAPEFAVRVRGAAWGWFTDAALQALLPALL